MRMEYASSISYVIRVPKWQILHTTVRIEKSAKFQSVISEN